MTAEAFQIRQHLAASVIPGRSIFGECVINDALQLQWYFVAELWWLVQDGDDGCRSRIAVKGIAAGDHFGDYYPQSPNVGALVHHFAQRLLG